MRSIERSLLAWVIGALSLGSVLVMIVSYLVTLEEMDEVFDAGLRNIAEAVSSYHSGHGPNVDRPWVLSPTDESDGDSEIVTLTWSLSGQRLYVSNPKVDIPFIDKEGLSRSVVDSAAWIVYTDVRTDGISQAAQRVSARREMARESAAKVLPPMLALVVLVGGLLVFALRRGMQPLDSAARDVAARSATALDPIGAEDVPKELVPLVSSINGLIQRLSVAFSAQRRFLAEAAHELRTPLTALRLQLQILKLSTEQQAHDDAIAELESGVERSQHLIEQLLQVARSEPDGQPFHTDVVDLGELVQTVVEGLWAQAEHAGIDLGVGIAESVKVGGDRQQLMLLLGNLVANALRYTPEGGVVDVHAGLADGHPTLRVVDNGPGIPEAERGRVFDRFYRGEDAQSLSRDGGGSGLGLSIVHSIASRHRATVTLHTAPSGAGLEVRVVFPRA
ncbi:MAG: ATP-binding protein [Burkholderiaceae bacterium]